MVFDEEWYATNNCCQHFLLLYTTLSSKYASTMWNNQTKDTHTLYWGNKKCDTAILFFAFVYLYMCVCVRAKVASSKN